MKTAHNVVSMTVLTVALAVAAAALGAPVHAALAGSEVDEVSARARLAGETQNVANELRRLARQMPSADVRVREQLAPRAAELEGRLRAAMAAARGVESTEGLQLEAQALLTVVWEIRMALRPADSSGSVGTPGTGAKAIGGISGRVTETGTSNPLTGVTVEALNFSSQVVDSDVTDVNGDYSLMLGDDSYKVRANGGAAHVTELYDDVACPNAGCYIWGGATVTVTGSTMVSDIDFELDPAGTISGTVTDGARAPLEGIEVEAWINAWTSGGATVTDASGAFSLGGLPAGVVYATAHDATGDYVDEVWDDVACPNLSCQKNAGSDITLTAGVTTSPIDFELGPAGKISGEITDAGSGSPITTQRIEVEVKEGWRTIGTDLADGSGLYTVVGLPAGSYPVLTDDLDQNYVDELYDGTLCPNGGCDLNTGDWVTVTGGATTADIDFGLGAAGWASGTVTDAVTLDPLSGLWVYLTDIHGDGVGSWFSDYAGDWEIGGLPTGCYFAWVDNRTSDDDYTGSYLREIYEEVHYPCDYCNFQAPQVGTAFDVVSESTTTGIDFTMDLAGFVSGTVTDSSKADPLEDVGVVVYGFIDGWWERLGDEYTDASGGYIVGGLIPGAYKVVADTSATHEVIGELHDSHPCPHGRCDTDEQGDLVSVVSGAATTVDFQLAQGWTISGNVSDEERAPLPTARVQAYSLGLGRWLDSATPDSNGNFTISGLPTGSYVVVAWDSPPPDYVSTYIREMYDDVLCVGTYCDPSMGEPVLVTVMGGATGIDMVLAEGGSVSGTVTDGSRAPIRGLRLYLWDSTGTSIVGFAFTDASGDYEFVGLASGSYLVMAYPNFEDLNLIGEVYDDVQCLTTSCDTSGATPVVVAARAATTDIDFTLDAGGSISGTVTDEASGLPLPGTSVWVYDSGGGSVRFIETDCAGDYSLSGLITGSYFVLTRNDRGYADEVYNNIPCSGCSSTSGTAVAVTQGAETPGIDFALGGTGTIAGTVTDSSTGSPISGIQIDVWGAQFRAGSAVTDASGGYSVGGLAPGTYHATTESHGAYLDELYDNLPCGEGCTIDDGTAIVVSGSATTTGIDFALDPDPGPVGLIFADGFESGDMTAW